MILLFESQEGFFEGQGMIKLLLILKLVYLKILQIQCCGSGRRKMGCFWVFFCCRR